MKSQLRCVNCEKLIDSFIGFQAERINIEERYSSLQEEAQGLTRKLKKVTALLMSAKEELKDVTQENQREMEGLLDNVRQLTKELALQETIEKIFIPDHYKVESMSHCNRLNLLCKNF